MRIKLTKPAKGGKENMNKIINKKIDVNSSENQKIKGRFVAREVLTCFSYEMEAVLRASQEGNTNKDYPLPTYEDIENYYEWQCPECGEGYQDEDEARECHGERPKQERQEILEWWIVSSYLYNKLKERGHAVLEWGNNYYWGRCTTGQAILLDGVISDICKEMEILTEYSWGK